MIDDKRTREQIRDDYRKMAFELKKLEGRLAEEDALIRKLTQMVPHSSCSSIYPTMYNMRNKIHELLQDANRAYNDSFKEFNFWS